MVLAANHEIVHHSLHVLVQSSAFETFGFATHGTFCFTAREQAATTRATEMMSTVDNKERLREQLSADGTEVHGPEGARSRSKTPFQVTP